MDARHRSPTAGSSLRGNITRSAVATGYSMDRPTTPTVREVSGVVKARTRLCLPRRVNMTTFVVTTSVDVANGDVSENDLSLREAIELANTTLGAERITFADGI